MERHGFDDGVVNEGEESLKGECAVVELDDRETIDLLC